ncbi:MULTISPECIES: alkaline phosphatase family protein [unclassified Pseudodesulfovibrio]|uniref:alkaline phosphatase family protein n=1 Tax=unclassified Pseudodesulfovibrio TaxID=2661612 RepID=UPI000FEC16E8|nr:MULTISPECIES: alkaline phosphatase family protein [unclassified Pseudodesulfovibrio]MCJ2163720.1 alkaline phosphatase family protein [Pseudodesulfovibrio sp. S3-i]RWU06025.1 phosphodiesterase [Pseudodesulfovibrio sp. S3]
MSLLLPSQPRRRLVVLGLDGLSLDLAKTLGASLPNIGRIAAEATTVRAELPELSPVNWTSFFTGTGPEGHGIFGFSRIDPDTYALRISGRTDVTGPTIFDLLGDKGLISRVINLPNTYPAHPMRGMLVSGFVAHDLEHAAYPPFLKAKLEEINYKLEADTNRGKSDLGYLLDELRLTLQSRLNALDLLWPDLGWDLFIHVFTETDRLFHFFMDAVLHLDHPDHLDCMAFLAEWDHALGVFLERYDALAGPKRLMVLADHGFTEIKTEICLNTWLMQEGLLTLTGPPKDEWDTRSIASESKAFALDPGRIYIHAKDRFRRGLIDPEEALALQERIATGLMALKYNGEPVMKAVHPAASLYPGASSDQLPDLVCQSHPGFDLKAKFDRSDIFGLHGRTGTHTVDGAIYMDTEHSRPERIRNVGDLILQHFDITR